MTPLAAPVLSSPEARSTIGCVGLVAPPCALAQELTRSGRVQWQLVGGDAVTTDACAPSVETLVYVARPDRGPDVRPNLAHAGATFMAFRKAGARHAVVVSSTAVYGATPHHAGLAAESRPTPAIGQPVAQAWLALESLATAAFGPQHVTVLRAAPVPVEGEPDFYSRLIAGRVAALTVTGHDPTLQFLSLRDLCDAIVLAVDRRAAGPFNIVPAAPVPLAAALREAGRRRAGLPWTLHCAVRAVAPRARVASRDQMQFLRYHLTASPEKSAAVLGFVPRHTSVDTIRQCRGVDAGPSGDRHFDPFGLDREYIKAKDRGFLGFLRRRYWRVEARGIERIPATGGAVLVGMHRGFMPFDGVITLLGVVEATGRVPRFLIHPGVGLRFPFLFDLMSKLGGVIASHENADRVLASRELLAVYPEGIRGAFTMYRRAHRVGPSWRDDCIVFALRHRVPIVPFVTLGSAEIFPILARVDWSVWKRYTEWPFIPITPTFPLLPIPLPSKWHTLFLEPLDVAREHPSEAADDPAVVHAIGMDVRRRMEGAVAELRSRRRSIFFGSVFDGRAI